MKILQPGDTTTIWVNQGWRPCTVLARLVHELLVEYRMPNGTTALQVHSGLSVKSVSYRGLATRWLQAVVDAGQTWDGSSQGKAAVPSPAAMLAARLGRLHLTDQGSQSHWCGHSGPGTTDASKATCKACLKLVAEATAMEAASLADPDTQAAMKLAGPDLDDLVASRNRDRWAE